MGSHIKQAIAGNIHRIREFELEKVNLIDEFDILQIVGEGWFGKILLVEHKATDMEMVLKALPKPYTPLKDFYREFHYGLHLGVHKHIISTYDVAFETAGFFVFSQEYAPLGDLTSNVSEIGIGELHTKRVAKQLASALEHIHNRDLVHRDIKLDNILVFKSDFSRIKLCDFGETRRAGSVVLRRNEWLPYAAPEILEVPTDENYKCNTSHDVWQFGIVIFVCLTGCLPWQKAAQDDPRYVRYMSWQNSSLPIKRQPKLFKLVSSKAQRFFKRYLEPKPERRQMDLSDVSRYLDDRWMSKGMEKTNETLKEEDGLCPSMYSFHSSPDDKNKLLRTLTQYGLEATVDRTAKKDRIRQWIQNSVIPEEEGIEEDIMDEENIKIHDHEAGPIGEQVRHRGPIAEHRVKRRHAHTALSQSTEKVYKPPVDPRIPLERQKSASIAQINKIAFQEDVRQEVREKENQKSKNTVPNCNTASEKVITNPENATETGENFHLTKDFQPTTKTSIAKLISSTQNGGTPKNNQIHRRIEVRTSQKSNNGILNALPFKNVKIAANSPTSSDSAISSDSSMVKFKVNVQLPQNNKTSEIYEQKRVDQK